MSRKRQYHGNPDALPWERQDGESQHSYESFKVWRDMEGVRSLRGVAEIVGRSYHSVKLLSSKYHWNDRADAYDRDTMLKAQAEEIKEIKAMRKRHAKMACAMIEKSARALTKIPDDEIKANEVARMVEVASRLERISRGDSGDVIEEREGEPIPTVQFYIPDNGRDG